MRHGIHFSPDRNVAPQRKPVVFEQRYGGDRG
jgi:hypothetical protein